MLLNIKNLLGFVIFATGLSLMSLPGEAKDCQKTDCHTQPKAACQQCCQQKHHTPDCVQKCASKCK